MAELKALRLVELQRQMRKQICQSTRRQGPADVLGDFRSMRRPKRIILRTVEETLAYENAVYREEEQRKRNSREIFLNAVIGHRNKFFAFHDKARDTCRILARAVAQYFTKRLEEKRRFEDLQEKTRLRALMENDEDTYRMLVKERKNSRLAFLLEKTDTYIGQFLTLVKQRRQNRQKEMLEKHNKLLKQQADEGLTAELDDVHVDEAISDIGKGPEEQTAESYAKNYYLIAHALGEKITRQPSLMVNGKLKDYQMQGLEWMVSLYNNDLNGILADEMGLGKTIQSISLVAYLIEVKKNHADRLALQADIRRGNFNVLITTYEYIVKDKSHLGKVNWDYLIVDEGHRMRNHESKLSQCLSQHYRVPRRLLLTGTPLQNSLPELWGLMNFLLPDVFNSCATFEEWFNRPFANTGETAELNQEETILVIRGLHKVLRPFLLRRLKVQVESQLPQKTEYVIKVGLTALQQSVYNQLKRNSMIMCSGGGANKMRAVNNAMMHLRKVCNHPYLFEEVEDAVNPYHQPAGPQLYRVSGKFELLDRMFAKLKASGHRVLLFCQMTRLLNIMEDYLTWKGYKYLCLTGSTKADDRGAMLAKFNAPDSEYFVFLLSTRAGGLGLNLQTADTVIIFDSDWNPFQDQQAQDRAHRIGQKNEVRVIRLVSMGTVEEYIIDAANRKLHMDAKVIQAGRFDQRTSAEIQRKILEELVSKDDELGKNMDNAPHTLEEVNEMLARTEEEYALYQKMDLDIIESSGGWEKRLIQKCEVPKLYFTSDEAIKKIAKPNILETHGRGRREHASINYSENLTENQFIKAVEEGLAPEEFAEAKKKRKEVREERSHTRALRKKGKMNDKETRRKLQESRMMEKERKQQERAVRRAERESRKRNKKDNNSVEGEGKRKSSRKRRTRDVYDSDASTPMSKPSQSQSESEYGSDGDVDATERKRRRINHSGRTSHSTVNESGSESQDVTTMSEISTNTSFTTSKRGRGRPRGKARRPISSHLSESIASSEAMESSESELERELKKSVKVETKPVKSDLPLTDQLYMLWNGMRDLKDDDQNDVCELFLDPPDRSEYPDYYITILNPMALNMIHDKIAAGKYTSIDEMEGDVDLMVTNAKTYNEEESEVYDQACHLWDVFTEVKSMLNGTAGSRFATPTATSDFNDVEEDNEGGGDSDSSAWYNKGAVDSNDDVERSANRGKLPSSRLVPSPLKKVAQTDSQIETDSSRIILKVPRGDQSSKTSSQ
eukprot:Ihof_evm1s747 gene=Ihof_evmTU1s747